MSDIMYLPGFMLICLAIAAVIEAAMIEDKQLRDRRHHMRIQIVGTNTSYDGMTGTIESSFVNENHVRVHNVRMGNSLVQVLESNVNVHPTIDMGDVMSDADWQSFTEEN